MKIVVEKIKSFLLATGTPSELAAHVAEEVAAEFNVQEVTANGNNPGTITIRSIIHDEEIVEDVTADEILSARPVNKLRPPPGGWVTDAGELYEDASVLNAECSDYEERG